MDSIGAGCGEWVLLVSGCSARQAPPIGASPVDLRAGSSSHFRASETKHYAVCWLLLVKRTTWRFVSNSDIVTYVCPYLSLL
ncbi:hypothetical protein G6X41_14870, partial [Staphylococcus aureus]|nr:hypothetical protein [Staphylococcus aureus]